MKLQHIMRSAFLVAGLSVTSQAATIAWTNSFITDENDISFDGTLVEAINTAGTLPGEDVTVTVGGSSITFVENNAIGNNNTNNTGFFALNTGNTDYNTLLNTIDFGPNAQSSATYTFTSLTLGNVYQVQFWYADDAGVTAGRTMTLDGTGDSVITADSYATGTFTADATTQDLTWTSSAQGIRVTALQLRAVPEPSSAALLGLAGLALIARRKR
ncbi:MAG: PEP-CTERM sorting domain-containing protein [Akkermansiaceae bacterium]